MSKIRQSARGEECTFQIPGVCSHDPETVVLCHAPHPDKGMGTKGPDTWAAYGCSACHDAVDGRVNPLILDWWEDHDKEQVRARVWYPAIRETQRRLIKKGLMPS